MRLFFFTNTFPDGVGETWKKNEIHFFKNYFSEVHVLPFINITGRTHTSPFGNVIYHPAIFDGQPNIRFSIQNLLKIVFNKNGIIFLRELLLVLMKLSKPNIISWFNSSYKIYLLEKQFQKRELFQLFDDKSVLYFFWGRELSEMLVVRKFKARKILCRFHGYDLYRERNNGYIPYQKSQIHVCDYALPCSEFGTSVLKSYYPQFSNKISTQRLGVLDVGESASSEDNILRIVSCSFLIPLKRVDLILEALRLIDPQIRVEWTHIGDGPLFNEIKTSSLTLPPNIKCIFLGFIEPEKVQAIYITHPFDLFLNVSSTEGVPVSIMESLSAGIPVAATNVGGTSEIIDNSVGFLMDADLDPSSLKSLIEKFYNLEKFQKYQYRKNAKERYFKMCQFEMHSNSLLNKMIQ